MKKREFQEKVVRAYELFWAQLLDDVQVSEFQRRGQELADLDEELGIEVMEAICAIIGNITREEEVYTASGAERVVVEWADPKEEMV